MASPRASKPPEFDPPTTTPRELEKKRDGFQTLPNDASPPPTSTNSSTHTGAAPPSANSPQSSASIERPWPATSTATASRATANRPHGTTRSSGKRPSSTRPDCRWPTSPTSSESTHRPSPTASDAQAFQCDREEAGTRVPAPSTPGDEQYRGREKCPSRTVPYVFAARDYRLARPLCFVGCQATAIERAEVTRCGVIVLGSCRAVDERGPSPQLSGTACAAIRLRGASLGSVPNSRPHSPSSRDRR